MRIALLLSCVFSYSISFGDTANILAIFPFQARSHYAVYEPLLQKLSENGHELHVISHFPQKQKIKNLIDIDVSSSLPSLVETLPLSVVDGFTFWKNVHYMWEHGGVGICDPVLKHPGVRELLNSNKKFDLIITELFATDCFLGFVHKFDVPYVGVVSSVSLPWTNELLRNPENPSYIPNYFSPFSDRMSFYERSLNLLGLLVTKLGYRLYSGIPSHDIAKKHFGSDLPSFDELRTKVSLVLVNGHHSITTPRALAPGVKEIGGIHIPKSGPPSLPYALKEYLDSARDGVVYFSMGSQVDSSTFSYEMLAALYKAFAELRQQVLWKCPQEKMTKLPKNVKCIDWVPQISVLCHPNVRLFMTHGGLLGTQEAVYCGVPILGMPLFGDQFLNVAHFVRKGIALKVDFYRPSYEQLSNNLRELLTEERYAVAARKASRQFEDRPLPPLEEAVYWVEYIIRHGPNSLKTGASELTWYQYLLLDVLVVVGFSILLILFLLFTFIRSFYCREKQRIDVRKKRK